jgi:hypothetical protein
MFRSLLTIYRRGTSGKSDPESRVKGIPRRLVQAGLAKRPEVRGCTTEQIAEVAAFAGSRLPRVYELFLKKMGLGAGSFCADIEMFYPEILTLRGDAEELLREGGAAFTLSDRDFVFSMYQGFQFMYFRLDGSEDPPIFLYLEGQLTPQKNWPTVSAYLLAIVEEDERRAAGG